MGIRKVGDLWEVNACLKGRRLWAKCPTEIAAKERLDALKAQLVVEYRNSQAADPGTLPDSGGWTLGRGIDTAQSVHWSGTKSEAHLKKICKHLGRQLGRHTPLAELTTAAMDAFKDRCQKDGNANGTINRKLAALSIIFNVAIERGGAVNKPRLKYKKEGQGRSRYLSPEEEVMVLSTLKQWGKDLIHDLVVVLLDTGMRLGEALKLTAKDIDAKLRIVRLLDRKNGDNGGVPMTNRVHLVLTRLQFTTPTGRLFPLTTGMVDHVWDKVRTAMCLGDEKEFVIHALRHTCASRLVQRGISLQVVKEWLGHRSIVVTMRYAHLTQENLKAAIRVLEPDHAVAVS